jgi:sulfate transport system ATP-binding protein
LGPSGSGKTTLLRVIAGLETPDAGSVHCEDEDVTRTNPRQRNVGFVFQHYALFRHMSVYENIAFGLRVRRENRKVIDERVRELLHLVRLENLERRFPAQLSGGQRQRVALARALAIRPKVLLLDEPFGALDAKVREELRTWLRRLHDEIHVTSVLVTHDQEEALEVADRVVVMNQAHIEQVGSAEEVFHNPATDFVVEFLGQVNVFHGRVQNGQATLGGVSWDYPGYAHAEERPAKVYMRPHELDIKRTPNGAPHFAVRISRINAAGSIAKITALTNDGQNVVVDLALDRYRELDLKQGEAVFVYPKNARVFVPDFQI